jgi:POT family proton-dependent oligopeptide transporter
VLVAPRAYASQMMGIWWLAAALGAGIGGQLARLYTVLPHPTYFLVFAVPPLLVAAVLVARRDRLSRSLVPAGTNATPVPVEATV